MAKFTGWDKVWVINLDASWERFAEFCLGWAKPAGVPWQGPWPYPQRFPAYTARDAQAPSWYLSGDAKNAPHAARYWACRASHLAVWRRSLAAGYGHVLILEDDADPTPEFREGFPRFFESMPDGWMGYWAGFFPWNAPQRVNDWCDRSRGYGGLHAYGLNRQGLHRAIDHVEWHSRSVIDHALAGLHREEPHFYAPTTEMVKQRKGVVSDITGTVNDYCYS